MSAAASPSEEFASVNNNSKEPREITLTTSGKSRTVIPIKYLKRSDMYYTPLNTPKYVPPEYSHPRFVAGRFNGIPIRDKVLIIGSDPPTTGRVVSVYSPPGAELDHEQYIYGINFNEAHGQKMSNKPWGFYEPNELKNTTIGKGGGRRRKSRKSKKARKTRRRH